MQQLLNSQVIHGSAAVNASPWMCSWAAENSSLELLFRFSKAEVELYICGLFVNNCVHLWGSDGEPQSRQKAYFCLMYPKPAMKSMKSIKSVSGSISTMLLLVCYLKRGTI